MREKKVIFVTTMAPSEVGHGGVHRSCQIPHEPELIIGPGQVLLFTKQLLAQTEQNEDHDQEHPLRTGRGLKQSASRRTEPEQRNGTQQSLPARCLIREIKEKLG